MESTIQRTHTPKLDFIFSTKSIWPHGREKSRILDQNWVQITIWISFSKFVIQNTLFWYFSRYVSIWNFQVDVTCQFPFGGQCRTDQALGPRWLSHQVMWGFFINNFDKYAWILELIRPQSVIHWAWLPISVHG